MFYQKQNTNGDLIKGVISLLNKIPVQEAFMIYAHDQYVIGGTRGSYKAAYSYITTKLPSKGAREFENEEIVESIPPSAILLEGWVQTNRNNTEPTFEYHPASRVFRSEMRVFPNPSSGVVYVGGKVDPRSTIRVIDVMGRLVLEKRIEEGKEMLELDMTGHASGVYYVEMISTKGIVSEQFIIQ
ncbi:MAG: T9SS type A sorting domain-containing protein [Saprospiraceae bacterium]|nr:T9SS type A sorting domain-containing protein [Saprospiraceae bacterium]